MGWEQDLVQIQSDMTRKNKRFKLLKDIPGIKAGAIFCQDPSEPIYIVPESVIKHGGFLSGCHKYNLYEVDDDFTDFFEPIKSH